jgi:hypothetical protein
MQRFCTVNSLHEALEQAAAEDGLEPHRIEDENGEIVATMKDITAYRDARDEATEARDAAIAAAHDDHAAALVAAAES